MTVAKAASASLWSAIDIGARQGIQFAVSIILARLLTPGDFGVIALLTFFTSLASMLLQSGLATALVQHRDVDHDQESAVFCWNLITSIALAAILMLIAPVLARFYAQPVLTPLMGVAAAQIILSALSAVQYSLLTRNLRFDQLTKVGLVSSFGSGVLAVGAAMAGAGVWALAWQILSAALITCLMLWIVCRWRPKLTFRVAHIRPLLNFGAWLSLSSLLDVLYTQGFSLLIGKLHGITDLGFYNRASNTQQLPSNILSSVVTRVSLPLFADRSNDPEALRRGMRLALSFTMLFNVPAMVGLALLAGPIVQVLFGSKWLPAAPILSILAVGGVLIPLHIVNLHVLLAIGRSQTFFRLEVIKKVIGIGSVVIGSFFGIAGLAWSQVVFGVLALGINVGPMQRHLAYGLVEQTRDLAGIYLAAAIMAAAVLFGQETLDISPLLNLITLSSLGAIVYVVVGFGLRLRSFMEAWSVGRSLLQRQDAVLSV